MKRSSLVLLAFVLIFGLTSLYAGQSTPKAPVITQDPKQANVFFVSFPEGGFEYACTEWKSLSETVIQEDQEIPWMPRSCGGLEDGVKQTSYVERFPVAPNGGEWEVRAILQTEDATEYPSNTLHIIY